MYAAHGVLINKSAAAVTKQMVGRNRLPSNYAK